jgi:two-component system nitrate/nitrite response regulator NarL
VVTALTPRERQIMRLVSEGLSNKEIGRRLNIVDGTMKVHLHNIFQKLEIRNRTVLAALARRLPSAASEPPERVDELADAMGANEQYSSLLVTRTDKRLFRSRFPIGLQKK